MTGFSKRWQGCSEGFPKGDAWGKSWGGVLPVRGKPDYFTQIYILFQIGFQIVSPKMHKQFRIGLHKIHRRFRTGPPKINRPFCIGPPQVSLNLLPPEFHRRGILLIIAIMKEKQQNILFEIEWNFSVVVSWDISPTWLICRCFASRLHWRCCRRLYSDTRAASMSPMATVEEQAHGRPHSSAAGDRLTAARQAARRSKEEALFYNVIKLIENLINN